MINCSEIQQNINASLIAFADCKKYTNSDLITLVELIQALLDCDASGSLEQDNKFVIVNYTLAQIGASSFEDNISSLLATHIALQDIEVNEIQLYIFKIQDTLSNNQIYILNNKGKGILNTVVAEDLFLLVNDTNRSNYIKSNENLTLAQRVDNTLYGILDRYTGENITLEKTTDLNTADGVIYFNLGSEKFKRTNSEVLNVKWFGAKGDGITDDSTAIRNAISKMPLNKGKLYFPPGLYIHGNGTNPSYPLPYSGSVDIGTDISLYFENYTNFEILGYGAKIKSNPNNSCIKRNRIFHFRKCNDGFIKGLEVDGSIVDREPSGGDPSGFNSQNNFLFDTCKRIKITDVVSNNSVMDGFTITSERLFEGFDDWSEDIIFENCVANYSYRQGMSVINAKRTKVINSEFSYTGTIFGASPMAGIDFEEGFNSAFGRGQINSLVSGCKFIDNVGTGVSLHYGTSESTIENSYFKNNDIFIPNDTTGLTVNNTIINNNLFNSSIDVDGGGEYIYNNILKGDGTKPFKIIVNDSNSQFATLKSKKQIIKKNYIELLSNPVSLTNEYGSVFLFSNNIEYINNFHRNVKSSVYIFNNNTALNQIIKNNIWENTGGEVLNSIGRLNLNNVNIFENNVIDKVYSFINTEQFSEMNIKDKTVDKNIVSKTFLIPTMLANKCIDIILPAQSLAENFDVKIKSNSVFFAYDAIGSREDQFNSLNNKRKLTNVIGNVLNGFDVSDIIVKGGKKVITLKTKADSSQNLGILVELFYYSKNVNPDNIYLSTVYDIADLSGQVFRNIYHGGLSGNTANRPLTLGYTEIELGAMYFDTTIGKPIWFNGTNWIDATATVV